MFDLKLLQQNIITIIATIAFIIQAILTLKKTSSNKKLEKKGFKKQAKWVEKLKRDKIDNQKDLAEHDSKIAFNSCTDYYCKVLKARKNSLKWYQMNEIMEIARKHFVVLMKNYIIANEFVQRNGDKWTNYKNNCIQDIFKEIQDLLEKMWAKEKFKIDYKTFFDLTNNKTLTIVYPAMTSLFDELRNISKEKKNEIEKNEKLLDEMVG